MMNRPTIDGAPGLVWRPRLRVKGWAAYWVAPADNPKYQPRSRKICIVVSEPDGDTIALIRQTCQAMQDDVKASTARAAIDPSMVRTVRDLCRIYRQDEASPFHNLRYGGRKTYAIHLDALARMVGDAPLAALKGRDFLRWYGIWTADGAHVPRAHARINMFRMIVSFGVVIEIDHCDRLALILSKMKFDKAGPRTEILTRDQAAAIIARAHETGDHEIALVQALQFELGLRPKDVIGEWVPLGEPGTSDVIARGMKWVCGLRWDEISPDLILTHRLSKSLHGRAALVDPRAGKTKRWELRLYPMVMQELNRLLCPNGGEIFQNYSGPLVLDHRTGQPFASPHAFRNRWRPIADAAGVPRAVQNRDSRAGHITERIVATGGNLEAARMSAGHSDVRTTTGYSRQEDEVTADAQRAVVAFRARKREEQ